MYEIAWRELLCALEGGKLGLAQECPHLLAAEEQSESSGWWDRAVSTHVLQQTLRLEELEKFRVILL